MLTAALLGAGALASAQAQTPFQNPKVRLDCSMKPVLLRAAHMLTLQQTVA